ncbi:DUF2249 domain-containing protein [Paludibacterium paludis]|uniref:DUF2249 domain-containing protein n=1 Tax=Paludibacterium paludis TaxID=1225769 RepID=A0A918UBR4_9NEIS|nr:DUF2249 domain-containing protein [Paludibacterium paludis]GGY25260.1 hypothetical protein GCM10011289_31030 [Paludibacterium paludis]
MSIDLRHLPPPEPMEIILDRADTMVSGDTAAYTLPHFPSPLLPLLEERGMRYRFDLSGDGGVTLHLEKP